MLIRLVLGSDREDDIENTPTSANPTTGTNSVIAKASSAAFGTPLVSNILRGHIAEAVVALALEPEWTWCGADFAGWDFERTDGLRLEVKQSAAQQTWISSRPSNPSFDIAARTGYWEKGTIWIARPGRQAHLYIFAYHGVYGNNADHRDPSQWEFYVVAARSLPDQKRIGLKRVQTLTSAVGIEDLARVVAVTTRTVTDHNILPGRAKGATLGSFEWRRND